jgi:uncharacterized membrane protein YqjE
VNAQPSLKPSIAGRIRGLWLDFSALACAHLELAVLEFEEIAHRLALMLGIAVTIATLTVSAWLALVAGGIAWATSAGIPWPVALLIGAIANLLLAGGLALWLRANVGELRFTATLRQIRRSAGLHDTETL